MAFQVPASKASIGQDKFDFGPETGTEYSVRKAKFLSLDQINELENGAKATRFFAGEDLDDKGELVVSDAKRSKFIHSLELEQFQELTKAWRADSGLTAGE